MTPSTLRAQPQPRHAHERQSVQMAAAGQPTLAAGRRPATSTTDVLVTSRQRGPPLSRIRDDNDCQP